MASYEEGVEQGSAPHATNEAAVMWEMRMCHLLYEQAMARFLPRGVTLQQYMVLRHLAGGTASVGLLADLFGVRQPTMSVLLARLHQKGLVKRRPGQVDGRHHFFMISATGRSLLRKLEKPMQRFTNAFHKELEAELAVNLLNDLRLLRTRLARVFL
jgi:DNA-binding MarR family transcriptional regulator